jgi:hypothetical protein
VDGGEAFGECRGLESAEGGGDGGYRDFLFAGTEIVAANRILERGFEIVRENAEACGAGGNDVAGAVFRERVSVVDDEWLLGLQARGEEKLFAGARVQHVQVDADVRIEKAVAIEGRFAGCLRANKDDGFHCFLARGGSAFEFRQLRRTRAVTDGFEHGNVGEAKAFASATEHQPAAAHVTAADKFQRKEQAASEYFEKRLDVFRGCDAAEENCLAVRAHGLAENVSVALERNPIARLGSVDGNCGNFLQFSEVNPLFRLD